MKRKSVGGYRPNGAIGKILILSGLLVIIGLPAVPAVPQNIFSPAAIACAAAAEPLPVLVDLGADRCIPCKMMAPILKELEKDYADEFEVTFYDVWKDPAPAHKYGIRGIPTQVFLDKTGKELYRHEGYFSKEQILAKWRELGYDFH